MNYIKHYDTLIQRARTRILKCYTEKHHIMPRCMGGSDDSVNIVKLTPEEHYVAHQLLVKIYPNNTKLIYAANMMVANRKSNKAYGWLKRKLSIEAKKRKGNKNGSFGKRWIHKNTENRKLDKNIPLPEGWNEGRRLKAVLAPRKKKGKPRIASIVDPNVILELYESGMKTEDIAKKFGWKTSKAVVMFLNIKFPNRRKFAPREQRSRSVNGNTHLW